MDQRQSWKLLVIPEALVTCIYSETAMCALALPNLLDNEEDLEAQIARFCVDAEKTLDVRAVRALKARLFIMHGVAGGGLTVYEVTFPPGLKGVTIRDYTCAPFYLPVDFVFPLLPCPFIELRLIEPFWKLFSSHRGKTPMCGAAVLYLKGNQKEKMYGSIHVSVHYVRANGANTPAHSAVVGKTRRGAPSIQQRADYSSIDMKEACSKLYKTVLKQKAESDKQAGRRSDVRVDVEAPDSAYSCGTSELAVIALAATTILCIVLAILLATHFT